MSGNAALLCFLRHLLLQVEALVPAVLCFSPCRRALRMLQLCEGREPACAKLLHVSSFIIFQSK